MAATLGNVFSLDGTKLQIKDTHGKILAIITPSIPEQSRVYGRMDKNINQISRSYDNTGNVDFEEDLLRVSDWTLDNNRHEISGVDNNRHEISGEHFNFKQTHEQKVIEGDWSIWYPVSVLDMENVELLFTYLGHIQTITIPTVTGLDLHSLSMNSLLLGEFWAIEPKDGGLTFYFKGDSDQDALWEAQTDLQPARYLTRITKVRYISCTTV